MAEAKRRLMSRHNPPCSQRWTIPEESALRVRLANLKEEDLKKENEENIANRG